MNKSCSRATASGFSKIELEGRSGGSCSRYGVLFNLVAYEESAKYIHMQDYKIWHVQVDQYISMSR